MTTSRDGCAPPISELRSKVCRISDLQSERTRTRAFLSKYRHVFPTVLLVRVQCLMKSLHIAVEVPSSRSIVFSMTNGSYGPRGKCFTILFPRRILFVWSMEILLTSIVYYNINVHTTLYVVTCLKQSMLFWSSRGYVRLIFKYIKQHVKSLSKVTLSCNCLSSLALFVQVHLYRTFPPPM